MQYNQIIKFLYSLERFKGIKLGLESINSLLGKLGNPHKELKVIHVAGTNGKGSVCAMLDFILQEAGYKAGRYTSPHLTDFRERFLINNKKITEKEIIKYFNLVKKHYTNQTYFEFITAMAFLYFMDKKVDFLVLEVGMGGRLDATNVVKPLVSVITNVTLEHTNYLGETIKAISYEKAGIIKEKIPTVTGAKNEALGVIKKICKEKNSGLFLSKYYKMSEIAKPISEHAQKPLVFDKTDGFFDVNNYKNLRLSLKGDFQLENAAVAVTVIDVLNKDYNLKINETEIKNGLKKVEWPGRLEFIGKNILVDCAHNPDAFLKLGKEIKKLKFRRLILVIGILKDKDIKSIIKIIEPLADKIVITKPKIDRAAEPEDIAKYFKKEYKIIEDVKTAFNYAKKIPKNSDLILVKGSIYVVGDEAYL